MRAQPIPLVGGAYADESRPWSQQDTINLLPTFTEEAGTRTESMLKTPPGLAPFVEVVDAPPVRGTHNCEGKLFAVIGPTLYQISNTQVAIPIGTVPGIGRVRMDHNQISQGNELTIVTGQAGYVYNTVTQEFGRITDPGFPGSYVTRFIGGYMVGIEPRGRYAFNSGAAAATEFNTLDRFTSEVRPDPLVSLEVSNNELLLLSTSSGEFFQITANAQQPFRTKGITIDKGCAGPYVTARADNTIFWLGSDGCFYMLNGYAPVRISKRPLEQAIRGLDWNQAFAEVWEDSGYTVIYWTFPDGRTWGYDVANREWHRRGSYGLDRWRVNSLTRWNDRWIAGDFQRGRLWELDWDYILEGDQEFISERTMAVIHDNQNLVVIPRLELVMDTGQEETSPRVFPEQPTGPSISGSAPDGFVATPYSGYQYTVAEGDASIASVSIFSGELPDGLAISADAEIDTGTPIDIGSFTFTIRVTDTNGLYAELTDSITIVSIAFATTIADEISITQEPYDWSGITDPGFDASNSRVESRNGKVFCFANDATGNAAVSSNGGGTWTTCTGLPVTSNDVVSVVYSEPEYLVILNSGTNLYYSTDGIAFSSRNFVGVSAQTTAAIAIDSTVIIARANSATARKSTDGGATWANCPLISPVQVWQMATDGTSIVVATNADIKYSTSDGDSWTSIPSPIGGNLCGIVYGNGKFLVISSTGATATSADGINGWTAGTAVPSLASMSPGNKRLEFDGVLFTIATQVKIITSPDAVTWTDRNSIGAVCIDSYRTGQ